MKKKILIIIVGLLLLAAVSNFYTGTTITLNGKQITGLGGYIATYLVLVVIAVGMVLVLPSVFISGVVLAVVFLVFLILFIPLLPVATLLLPGIVLGITMYFVYRLAKKKEKKKGTS